MSVIVPASDKKNTATALAVTNLATQVANTAVGTPAYSAVLLAQYRVNMEHVVELMVTGKLSPLTILSTCTYGT